MMVMVLIRRLISHTKILEAGTNSVNLRTPAPSLGTAHSLPEYSWNSSGYPGSFTSAKINGWTNGSASGVPGSTISRIWIWTFLDVSSP